MIENDILATRAGFANDATDDAGKAGNASATATTERKQCCNSFRFGGNVESQGYALMTVARGGIVMSNIFLSTAFIRLASDSAGCDSESEEECDAKVYGFRPSSLITMIAVVSGVLSAFLLPFIGAVVDYTPYRRAVGIGSALFITAVQGIQIWLTDDTWFPMAILQAINGFMYMVQVLAIYAYLPDIGREVGPETMTWFSALFTMCQFGAQAAYLIVNIAFAIGLKLGDVNAAQVSQGICVLWLFLTFIPGWWKKMPTVPALHPRPAGKSLVLLGFSQVWKTSIGINKHYRSGLRWFFLAVVFAESGANAFTVVSVTFMVEVLKMTGAQVGIIFLVTLISTIPGSKAGQFLSKKTNPITSWKINLVTFSAVTVAGSFVLTGPERQNLIYPFGAAWGFLLGWFYPLENVVFTLSVPKGQETELSGFYTYCRSILTWLPPLVFTVMNESGLHMKWGLLSLIIFLIVGLFFLFLMAPWEDVLEDAKVNRMSHVGNSIEFVSSKNDNVEEGIASSNP
mmetsp:Transcript_26378/g.45013  ORF Transcript_26378/g.45013 Transcript_26378/m.45013 type:complete len:514 (+) Transcript_26378:212-1753(+)|eukprot:CAMPEP_0183703820 /NCGR_PEP_ID=MMETSP0737-20130205/1409_1 /TAXON_ID=385413 /ORGANISM="Thalassiosira miniscula, Strain CCMP1093" /LENGTH=513 /DNA_ID=CAMNT_0025930617 /DNA_START=210 /DNA_END=1751 /DNA_ORIENTATION=+